MYLREQKKKDLEQNKMSVKLNVRGSLLIHLPTGKTQLGQLIPHGFEEGCSTLRVEITLDRFVSGRQRILPFVLMRSEEKPAHVTDA